MSIFPCKACASDVDTNFNVEFFFDGKLCPSCTDEKRERMFLLDAAIKRKHAAGEVLTERGWE